MQSDESSGKLIWIFLKIWAVCIILATMYGSWIGVSDALHEFDTNRPSYLKPNDRLGFAIDGGVKNGLTYFAVVVLFPLYAPGYLHNHLING